MKEDLIWIGVVIAVLFGLWIFGGGPSRSAEQKPFITPPASDGSSQTYGNPSPVAVGSNHQTSVLTSNRNTTANNQVVTDSNTSPYQGRIHLSQGNASGATSANDEYIEIRADYGNKVPVNISGWTLKNGGDSRTYDSYGQIVKGQSNHSRLPFRAVNIWTSVGNKQVVPIKLAANERAYIVSGSPMSYGSPYNVQDSFRVNKCMGYIENLDNYRFTPNLSTNCPSPANDPTLPDLPEQCYNQLRSMGSCRTIDFTIKDAWCRLHVNDSARYDPLCNMPTYCKNIIQTHYTYESCVRDHQDDKDFYQPEWRLYLGSVWELWARRNETISLYDENGKLVDQVKYQ